MARPDLFSVPAMFIMLRESIEACVVVALLLQMCARLRLARMKKFVWFGAAAGIGVSVALGVVFVAVFYVTKSRVLSGPSQAIFKGYINLIAVLLITALAFAMLRFMNYERKWAAKLEDAASRIDVGRANQWTVFALAFTAVFREGVESVIFLAGVSTTSSWTAIPLAGIVGIAIGLAVGAALYYSGKQIKDIAWFFILSCALLFFIAAGLTSMAVVAWQSVGWFGTWSPPSDRPPWNRAVWDWSGCCSTRNQGWALAAAMFGYNARPTPLSLAAYFGYWAIILFDIGVKWARGTLTDATKGKKRYAVEEEGGGGWGGEGGDGAAAAADPSVAPHLLEPAHPACLSGPKDDSASETPSTTGAAGGKKRPAVQAVDVESGRK